METLIDFISKIVKVSYSLVPFGQFLGSIISGVLSDRLGRKKSILAWSSFLAILFLTMPFCQSALSLMALRLIAEIMIQMAWIAYIAYPMEVVGPKGRKG